MPIAVRPASPADRPALLALFRTSFGSDASAEDWTWKYDRCPHAAVSVGAFDSSGAALGFFGGLGTRYRGSGGDLGGVSAVDVMTAPSTRALGRRTLFQNVAAEFFERNGAAGAPFVLGFPNERHRLAGERTLDYISVEPAAEWTRPVARPASAERLHSGRLRHVRGASVSAAHDALAEIVHARPGWRTDRSRPTLSWRFARPGLAYDVHELVDPRGRSLAYAAVRLVGDRALLVDLQAADEAGGAVADLLDAVATSLHGTSARTLALRTSSASALAARSGELGFSPSPTDTHFTVRRFDRAFDLEKAARAFDYRFLDHDVF
jgi:hypothetical protein